MWKKKNYLNTVQIKTLETSDKTFDDKHISPRETNTGDDEEQDDNSGKPEMTEENDFGKSIEKDPSNLRGNFIF